MALQTLLFLPFACEISSYTVLEHLKIALRNMALVVLMLKERTCTWCNQQQYTCVRRPQFRVEI